MDFSFNKEKVEKECYKLLAISNLGEKSLKGYMKNPEFDKEKPQKEFTITEIAFLQRIAWCLEISRTQTKEILDSLFKGMPAPSKCAYSPKPLCTAKRMEGVKISVFEFYDFCTTLHQYAPHLKKVKIEDMVDIFCNFLYLIQNNEWVEHTYNGRLIVAESARIISQKMSSGTTNNSGSNIFTLHQDFDFYKKVMLLCEVLNGSSYLCHLNEVWSEWIDFIIKRVLNK